MTTERPITLQEHAMRFGTYMGLFWILKFIFLPIGFSVPLFHLIFLALTVFVPVLGIIYIRRYRDIYCEGAISFAKAFFFTILMYLFASLLTAVAHYIYFRFIDNGYLINSYIRQLESMKVSATNEMTETIEQLIDALGIISSLSPLELASQLLSQNFFCGLILALPSALLTMKRKKQQ